MEEYKIENCINIDFTNENGDASKVVSVETKRNFDNDGDIYKYVLCNGNTVMFERKD